MRIIFILRGASLIVQTAFRDGLSFDPFSVGEYCLPVPKVDIGWGQVFQALMVALMVVVLDERLALLFKSAG